MNTAVVTGATSMLGVALINSLLRHQAHRVFAVVQPGSKNLGKLPSDPRIRCIPCDCEKYEELPGLISEPCDAFFHFAWMPARGRKFADVEMGWRNIGQSLKALEAASRLGARVFVGAGSQSEYGSRRNPIQAPEDPSDPETAYAIAKDACRRMCMLKGRELEVQVRWVRIFSVYGPHDRKNTLISTVLPKLLKGEPVKLTACEQIWEFLYEDDAGEGLYHIGAAPDLGSDVYCLGSGEVRPLREFIEELRQITASESRLLFGEIPYSEFAIMNMHADISKTKEKTGWPGPTVSFQKGISSIIEVLKSSGELSGS